MARYALRLRRFFVHNVLHADDTPHRIALGAAIGVWVAFLPLVGIQMIVTLALAALARANRVVGVPLVWITNPFTIVPIYGGCLMLGRWILGEQPGEVTPEALRVLDAPADTVHLFNWSFWAERLRQFADLSLELWIGCLVAGTIAAVPAYFLTLRAVRVYRARRLQRIKERHLFRSQLRSARLARGEPA
ncbi:MAG: DUF2062 domain-containing protein [Phycisphaerae bacterium]|nr:DUF2062 domain-containing protein [Phycisphaerae bacterium]